LRGRKKEREGKLVKERGGGGEHDVREFNIE
jgi:hypothetical protein